MKVLDKFNNKKLSADGSIIPEYWKELVDNDEASAEEFETFFDDTDINDADDFSTDTCDEKALCQ